MLFFFNRQARNLYYAFSLILFNRRAGNLYYAAVPDKTTAHIHKLVAKQKVKKTKIRKKKVL